MKKLMPQPAYSQNPWLRVLTAVAALFWIASACTKKEDASNAPAKGEPAAAAEALPMPALLLTQAQFAWEEGPDGRKMPKPGPAKLIRLTQAGEVWQAKVHEDPDSRVFHKAICRGDGGKQMLTIAGTDAHLKTWRYENGSWQGKSHWNPKFGGKWDRLRDFEIGDVDHDGNDELVIATHDQGVIAVAEMDGEALEPKEVFARPNTFVHEIEIGDTEGQGKKSFFATPSEPNSAQKSQGGGVSVFRFKDGKYLEESVVAYDHRHAKEILVTDIDGDATDELYVSLEAHAEKQGKKQLIKEPLEIRQYKNVGGKWQERIVATLPMGVQARVLLVGDLKNSGKKELYVTTQKDGIWRLVPTAEATGEWRKQQIDKASSGFEHAAGLADMDGDGTPELYVAADDQDEVRRYHWDGNAFQKKSIYALGKSDLTWSIEYCGP